MAENGTNEHMKIASNEVKSVKSGEMVKMESLWKDQTCVVYFMRRFGCMFCRASAKDISALKPALDAQNVRLVGIGLEELGVEEFVEGGFFAGELYVDIGKKCYKDLDYNRTSLLGIIPSLIAKKGRDAISKGRQEKVGGNLQGDGYQSGGLIIVSAGDVFISAPCCVELHLFDSCVSVNLFLPQEGCSLLPVELPQRCLAFSSLQFSIP